MELIYTVYFECKSYADRKLIITCNSVWLRNPVLQIPFLPSILLQTVLNCVMGLAARWTQYHFNGVLCSCDMANCWGDTGQWISHGSLSKLMARYHPTYEYLQNSGKYKSNILEQHTEDKVNRNKGFLFILKLLLGNSFLRKHCDFFFKSLIKIFNIFVFSNINPWLLVRWNCKTDCIVYYFPGFIHLNVFKEQSVVFNPYWVCRQRTISDFNVNYHRANETFPLCILLADILRGKINAEIKCNLLRKVLFPERALCSNVTIFSLIKVGFIRETNIILIV